MRGWAWIVIGSWYAALNVAASCLFAWDKRAARRAGRRVPERTLLATVWLGGWAGAGAAMWLARHKTRRWAFRLSVAGAAAGHLVLCGLAWAAGR